MVRKSDEERLKELEEQMEKIKARKQQIQSRLSEKERKERTRRLIQVGALIEKHFQLKGEDDVLKMIYSYKKSVKENKEKIASLDIGRVRKELGELKKEEAQQQEGATVQS